jgi:hypothetical protein
MVRFVQVVVRGVGVSGGGAGDADGGTGAGLVGLGAAQVHRQSLLGEALVLDAHADQVAGPQRGLPADQQQGSVAGVGQRLLRTQRGQDAGQVIPSRGGPAGGGGDAGVAADPGHRAPHRLGDGRVRGRWRRGKVPLATGPGEQGEAFVEPGVG